MHQGTRINSFAFRVFVRFFTTKIKQHRNGFAKWLNKEAPSLSVAVVWLAVSAFCAFSAGAQPAITYTNGSELYVLLNCNSCDPGNSFEETNIAAKVDIDFTTNRSWSFLGQAASAQQDTHIQGLHLFGTGGMSAQATPHGTTGAAANDFAYALSWFSVSGSAASNVRFHLTAQLARTGAFHNGYAPSLGLLQDTQPTTTLAQLNDVGSLDTTGILAAGPFRFYVCANNIAFSNETAGASFTFDLQFNPLPAGQSQISAELLTGGDVCLTYSGIAGTNYVLDRAFDLLPPVNWIPQSSNTAGPGGALIFTNAPNKVSNNFWRIRSSP